MKSRSRPRLTPLTASLAALAVIGALAVPAAAAPPSLPTAVVPPGSVEIVDPGATPETASLFQYLQDIQGEGILYGQEHTTSYGLSIGTPDMIKSDVLGGVGDHPAIFAWDTLIIEGQERPGQLANTRAQNIELFAQYIEQADALGGINTISAHMENFVTGGSFYDTSGDTLRAVLPGGPNHDELKAYLDDIAILAGSIQDSEGNAIPIIFRPWHENAGSWFWWGAAYGSPGEYQELYRFTVEYLRDVKGVSNFLYAFSPGGGFGGDPALYLRTYPGDEYIDILGYDSYDNGNAGAAWLNGIVADLGMMSDLAIARNKVSAFTEFGVSTSGLAITGNPNLNWYTEVLAAIKADPKASRSAYMAQWANFGTTNFHVPYPAYGSEPDHELLANFQAYEADAYTLFADDVTGVFDRVVPTVAHDPLVHLVSPADGARVATSPTTIRASVQGATADSVTFDVGALSIPLTLDAAGIYWTGEWTIPPEDLNNSTVAVSVTATVGVDTLTDDAQVILGPRPVFESGVIDTFEAYGDDTSLRAEWIPVQANTITVETGSVGEGTQAMRFDYSFASQTYTGVGKVVSGDWSGFGELSLWIDPDASDNLMVLQLQAGGVSYEAYPSLAGDEPYEISIPWADWRPAPWDTANADRRITFEDLQALSQFHIYINSVPEAVATSGSVVVDNIRATGTPPPPVFSDVTRDHPFYKEIMWLYDQGLDNGYRDGKFHPNWIEKRQDVASLLYRYVGAEFTADNTPTYRDVRTRHPFYTEIEWLVAQGLVDVPTGRNPEFKPNSPLDRATAASLLYRLAGSPEVEITQVFTDVPVSTPVRPGHRKIPGPVVDADAIAWAVQTGVITPKSATVFGVREPVLRQDMAAYLYRYDQIPPPVSGLVTLFDFESGAQGWAPSNWEPGGSVLATGGTLQITSPAGGKNFGLDTPIGDLSAYSEIRVDLVSTSAGTDPMLALKLGSGWLWCQPAATGWTTTPKTMVFDLTTMSAECQGLLNDVKGIFLWFHEGEQVIDNVVAN